MVYIISAQRLRVITVEYKLEIATPSARNDTSLMLLGGVLPSKGNVAIYLKGVGISRLLGYYKLLVIFPLSHPIITPSSLLAS